MKQKSIKLNFIMNIILTLSSMIFPLITFRYVSRILLPVGMGKVSFANSLVSYFVMFAQLGIPTYGIRACAAVRDDREKLTRTAQELMIINIATCFIAYIAFAFVLIFTPKLHEEKILYIVVSLSIFFNSIGMEWLYKALEQYTYITVRSIAFKFIALVAMFVLIHTKSDYVIYGAITIFAASASNILNLIHSHKYIGWRPVGNYHFKNHLKAVLIFFAMACAATIYTHLDTIMLGFMSGSENVGYYDAAVKIKGILVSVVTSLGAVLLPRASYYVNQGNMEDFKRISGKALNFVFLLAAPLMVYFILFARQGIYFLSGPAYANSVLPMQIIMPTLLFIGITNILGIQILVPLGKEKIVLYSEIAGAIVNLIINSILIPRFVAEGAAIGTVVAEFVVLIVQYCALRDKVNEILKAIHYFRIMFAILISSVCSLWLIKTGMDNFLLLLVSAIVFFGVYGIYMLARKEELVIQFTTQIYNSIKKVVDHR